MKKAFPDLVKYHFKYLIDEYEFSVTTENEKEVILYSARCHLRFFLERTQVFLDIRPPSIKNWSEAFDLGFVILFKDPQSKFEYILDPEFSRDPINSLNRQLARLAKLLRQYCGEMLRGDFSIQKELEGFIEKKKLF